MNSKLRVCHIINDLPVGGAEMMLYKVLGRLDRREWEPEVISLLSRGPMAERIERLGIPVHVVGMRRGTLRPWDLWRLRTAIHHVRPDVVQTWLYHSNLVGGLASRSYSRNVPVLWNIRMNSLESAIDKRTTFWALKLGAGLSHRLPAAVIINSDAGRRAHQSIGYSTEKMVVVPNGFDLDRFQPSAPARHRLRREAGILEDVPLVGAVGRFHPHKDYDNLIQAAAAVVRAIPQARFLLCGKQLDPGNRELRAMLEHAGVADHFHLLGPREDVAEVHAALDVAVLSSCTEGFPNVVGEAMACGVPAVVTDVGAAAEIVGSTGRVVPPRDPQALAGACLELLRMSGDGRRELGRQARERIAEQFSLEQVTEIYMRLWREAYSVRRRPQRRRAA